MIRGHPPTAVRRGTPSPPGEEAGYQDRVFPVFELPDYYQTERQQC